MKSWTVGIGLVLVVGIAAGGVTSGQTPPAGPSGIDGLIASAKVAAGTDWAGTFLRLCIPPPSTPGARGGARAGRGANAAPGGRGGAVPAGAPAAGRGGRGVSGPPRETWYARPAKVADNLYFLGTRVHNAWALVGSQGIIVIEALFDYAAPDEILGGLKTLGLDQNKVKYLILSHAHGDHDGGAKFLQDSIPGVHLVYGKEDWDAVDQRTGEKPRRDIVGADGMTISVGDASLKIVTMPGHTPGTLSYLFEVKDNGKPMRIAYVGGTAIPFNGDTPFYDTYLASAKKMADAAAAYGATALLSNHTEFDNGFYKAETAGARKPGDPNPFEVGQNGVTRYFTVVQDCVTAAKLRATGK